MEENWLLFIEKCFKKFEYPNIYGLKMSEVFRASNRIFLLSWLYSLIHGSSTIEIVPEEVLCEFLNWFCKSSQVKGILKADMEYPIQLKILYKIFKSLDSIKKEYEQLDNFNAISVCDTRYLCQKEMNIFKNFGPIKICDEENLDIIVEIIKSNDNNEDVEFSSPQLKSEKLFQMEKDVKTAIYIVTNISKNVDCDDLNVELGNNDLRLFREFNEDIEKGIKYIKNVEALSEFTEKLNNFNLKIPVGSNDESVGMAKEVVKLIHDVNNM